MNHSFDVDIAVKHGVHAAVLFESIRFWVLKNKANGKHLHEGRHWTYNSAKAFSELFPYLSADQIQRSLKRLEEAGILVVGCFNQTPYDRTRWYSTADGCAFDSANLRNEITQECGTYTSSNQVQTNSPPTPKGESLPAGFAEFWSMYPKKVGKDAAISAWKRKVKTSDTIKTIMQMIGQAKESEAWQKESGRFVPNPATWINQGRWKDEAAESSAAPAWMEGVR